MKRSLLLMPVVALLGCAPALMPTPNLYRAGGEPLFRELAPVLETSSLGVLYVTDRAPEAAGEAGVRYGHERSASLAWGSVRVEIGDGLSWDEVVRHSV